MRHEDSKPPIGGFPPLPEGEEWPLTPLGLARLVVPAETEPGPDARMRRRWLATMRRYRAAVAMEALAEGELEAAAAILGVIAEREKAHAERVEADRATLRRRAVRLGQREEGAYALVVIILFGGFLFGVCVLMGGM